MIPLIIMLVKLHSLWPHLLLLTSSNKLRDVESTMMASDVVSKSVWLMLSVHDTEVGADTIMSSLVIETLLKKTDELIIVAELFVVLDEVLQVIGLDNDVESASLSKVELLSSNT